MVRGMADETIPAGHTRVATPVDKEKDRPVAPEEVRTGDLGPSGTGRWDRETRLVEAEEVPAGFEGAELEQRADQAQPTIANPRDADPRVNPEGAPTADELERDAAAAEAAGEPVFGDATVPAPLGHDGPPETGRPGDTRIDRG